MHKLKSAIVVFSAKVKGSLALKLFRIYKKNVKIKLKYIGFLDQPEKI